MNETQLHPYMLEQLDLASAEMFGDHHCSNISLSAPSISLINYLSLSLLPQPLLPKVRVWMEWLSLVSWDIKHTYRSLPTGLDLHLAEMMNSEGCVSSVKFKCTMF